MLSNRAGRILTCLLSVSHLAGAFVPLATTTTSAHGTSSSAHHHFMSTRDAAQVTKNKKPSFSAPLSFDEMVRQAAANMKQAASRGESRQIVRVLLPRDATSGDFGKYMEASNPEDLSLENSLLAPPDESWQGGIMQLYRAAAPTCRAILRELTLDAQSGLPPRIAEDRSVDESGVDGVSVFKTDNGSATCWLQPTQETVEDHVVRACAQTGGSDKGIFCLMNPQWRQVDDVLDSASQGDGFFSGLASFLGGKGGVLKQLNQAGFKPVYTLEGYVCRGANVRLLQTFDADWAVFCERDNGGSFVSVGTSPTRPTYQDVEQMLNDSDIGFKYTRDMGLQPKL